MSWLHLMGLTHRMTQHWSAPSPATGGCRGNGPKGLLTGEIL